MLTLTEPAVEAIRSLTSRPELPAGAGLRIVHGDTAGGLELHICPAPGAGDQIIETGGARVFVQGEAASMLGGKTLSAKVAADDVVFRID